VTTAADDGNGGLRHSAARTSGSLFTDWSHNTERLWGYVAYEQTGEGFRADNGYFFQSGMRRATVNFAAKAHPQGDWNTLQPFLFYQASQALADRSEIGAMFAPGIFLTGPHDLNIDLEDHPGMTQRVALGSRLHRFNQAFLDVTAVPASWFQTLEVRLTAGGKVDVAKLMERRRRPPGGTAPARYAS